MAFKITKRIIRDYLGCQDRDIVYGTPADAVLHAIREYRLELIRELEELETRDDAAIRRLFEEASRKTDRTPLPTSVAVRDFVTALRVLAILDQK